MVNVLFHLCDCCPSEAVAWNSAPLRPPCLRDEMSWTRLQTVSPAIDQYQYQENHRRVQSRNVNFMVKKAIPGRWSPDSHFTGRRVSQLRLKPWQRLSDLKRLCSGSSQDQKWYCGGLAYRFPSLRTAQRLFRRRWSGRRSAGPKLRTEEKATLRPVLRAAARQRRSNRSHGCLQDTLLVLALSENRSLFGPESVLVAGYRVECRD